MTQLLIHFGLLAFIPSLGYFFVNWIFLDERISKRFKLSLSFLVGLFLFLFLNFFYLFYLSTLISVQWFSFMGYFSVLYLFVFVFWMSIKVLTSWESIKTQAIILLLIYRKYFFFCVFLIVLFLAIAALPLFENDSLEYFAFSRQIVRSNSLLGYPPLESSWENSLYAPSTHPPFFHLLFATLVPDSGNLFFLKLVLFIGFLAMISVLVRDDSFGYGFLVAASTPIFIFTLQTLNVEPFRLQFFAGGLALIAFKKTDIRSSRFCLRLFLGFGMMLVPHSLGLLMAVLVFTSIAFIWRNWKYSFWSGGILVLSTIVFTPQYILNTRTFGFPVQDSSPIMSLPQIDFERDLLYRRELVGLSDMIVNGAFRSMLDFTLYGFVFLIGLIVSIFLLIENRFSVWDNMMVGISAMTVIMYTLISLISGLVGIDLLIKNVRYGSSILPCIIVVIVSKLTVAKRV